MCKLVGVGVDLCAAARMERAIRKPHVLERIFTEGERAYLCAQGKMAPDSAAAMFAAKEAVSKALGIGFSGGVMPAQIEVVHDDLGAPGIVLHGAARARLEALGGGRVMLSLTHENGMAAAFAVIESA